MGLVSIIIPIYNTEQYLKTCVDSVLEQTYTCFEIILVNDGSKDKCKEICNEYMRGYNNIFVQHNENQGVAASRRCGLESAHGDLIMFIDSDDWIDKDMLSTLVSAMKVSESDMVSCTYSDIFNRKGKEKPRQPFKEKYIECNSFKEMIHEIHGTRCLQTGPVAKLYKRKLFKGVDFREDITIGEDYTMILQVLRNAEKIRMIKENLYNRRLYGGNISRSGYTARHRKALENYLEVRKGLIEEFPEYRIEILGYHIEYEMAVLTAMCRNKNFDFDVIMKLKNDLRLNMKEIICDCTIPIVMKMSALMIAYLTPLFILVFRTIHLLFKR